MADRREVLRRRHWADVVVIVAGVYLFLVAFWSPGLVAAEGAARVQDHQFWWWTKMLAGVAALIAVLVVQRHVLVGRILVGGAALLALLGLLTFRVWDWVVLVTVLIPGLLLAVATPFFGPMPTPEEENAAARGP
jgi:hypothetical protein